MQSKGKILERANRAAKSPNLFFFSSFSSIKRVQSFVVPKNDNGDKDKVLVEEDRTSTTWPPPFPSFYVLMPCEPALN